MKYLNGPLGSRGGTSMASRASKRQGPSHHGHTLLSILVFIFAPSKPDIGRNWTSVNYTKIIPTSKYLNQKNRSKSFFLLELREPPTYLFSHCSQMTSEMVSSWTQFHCTWNIEYKKTDIREGGKSLPKTDKARLIYKRWADWFMGFKAPFFWPVHGRVIHFIHDNK